MGCASSTYQIVVVDGKGDNRHTMPPWQGVSVGKAGFKKDGFTISSGLGKGKFGAVFCGTTKDTKKVFALKFIAKNIIYETSAVDRVQQEIEVLHRLDHPFIVTYFGGYETDGALVLVTDFCGGGELYTRMKQDFKMNENVARFYASEIAMALHYLHDTMQIVYRDLKPENILIDCCGHVKLCDMGFAVQASGGDSDSFSLNDNCGTAMYVAPEIAGGGKGGHSFPVDWWSFGCVVYEMVTGTAPFGDTEHSSKFEIFNNINSGKVSYPLSMSSSLAGFLKSLLERDPGKRASWKNVRANTWFDGVDWGAVEERRIVPPWQPEVQEKHLSQHFVNWSGLMVPGTATSDASRYCQGLRLMAPGRHALGLGGRQTPLGTPGAAQARKNSGSKGCKGSPGKSRRESGRHRPVKTVSL